MKNLFLISLLSTFLIACNNKASIDDALDHNEQLVKLQSKLIDAEQNFVDAFIDGTIDDAKKAADSWRTTASDIKSQSEKIKPIDDQDEMRKSLVKLSKVHLEIANNQIPELLSIVEESENSEIDDSDYNRLTEEMNTLIDEIDSKSRGTNKEFLENQKTFAKRYDIQLR